MKKIFTLLILLPSAALAQNTKTGSITGTTCFGIDTTNAGTIGISVQNSSTGSAWSGTIQPQGSIGGDPPANIQVTPSTGGAAQSTITANGVYIVASSGYTYVQVCGNTVTNTAAIKMFPAQYSKNFGGGGAAATGIQTGAALPAVPCANGGIFSLNSTSSQSNTFYRCSQLNGSNGIWQQIKPTVETVYAKDYGVQATSQIISDATTVNTSSTITCPNSDCNFTTTNTSRTCGTNACVGDLVFAAGPLSGSQTSSLVCPQSTIATINSAQSITLTAANDCTANQTANAQLVWGPDDTTPLINAYAAAVANCNILQLPAGIMLVQAAEFNTPNTTCGVAQPYRIPGVFGASSIGTTIVPTPNFVFTNCSGGGRNACFFGVNFQLDFYMEINGIGLSPAAGCPANINLVANSGGVFYDMLFEGWCNIITGGGTTPGMFFSANETEGLFGGTIGFGNPDCEITGGQNQLYNWPCFGPSTPGMIVGGGTQFISQGNDYSGVSVTSGSSVLSIGDKDTVGATTGWNINGAVNFYNYVFSANHGSTPITISGLNSKVTAQNTAFVSANSGAQNGQWLNADSTSQFMDLGGNTFSGTALSNNPSIVQSKSSTTSAGTTPYTQAFTNATCGATACPGNLLQTFVRWTPSTNTLSGCTDTLGNTWTQNGSTLTTTSTSGAAVNIAMLTVTLNKAAGGADTVSCSFSANNTFTTIGIVEWKQANAAYDLSIQTNSGNGTAVSGTQTTVTNNAVTGFVIADNVAGSLVSGTCSPINPCTAWPFNLAASAFYGLFQVVPTAGATTSAGTIGSTSDWAGFWFTLRPILSQPPMLNYPQSGTCTFSSTTCTVTFTQAFNVTPRCSAGDETAAAPIRTQPSLTQVILTGGTGAGATDVVDWNCK